MQPAPRAGTASAAHPALVRRPGPHRASLSSASVVLTSGRIARWWDCSLPGQHVQRRHLVQLHRLPAGQHQHRRLLDVRLQRRLLRHRLWQRPRLQLYVVACAMHGRPWHRSRLLIRCIRSSRTAPCSVHGEHVQRCVWRAQRVHGVPGRQHQRRWRHHLHLLGRLRHIRHRRHPLLLRCAH